MENRRKSDLNLDEAFKVYTYEGIEIKIPAPIRIKKFKEYIKEQYFSRKDYLSFFEKHVSTATASRDLKLAVDNKIMEKFGDKSIAKYKFIK